MYLNPSLNKLLVGNVQQFDPDKETFKNNSERLDQYLIAKNVGAEKKVADCSQLLVLKL